MKDDEHLGPLWRVQGVGGSFTNQENIYFRHLKDIGRDLSSAKVLEIGPGNGDFAAELIKLHNITDYTFLDIERTIAPAIKNVTEKLRHRRPPYTIHDYYTYPDAKIKGVPSQKFETIMKNKFDLVVSNVCIPETPVKYRQRLLNNLLPRAGAAMIIGQLTSSSTIPDDGYGEWIKNLFESSFDKTSCTLTDYKGCYAWIGYNYSN